MNILFEYINTIVLMGRMFVNGPGDRGSSPRLSHTKDSKMVLVTLLNTQHYISYSKGCLRVTLKYGRPLTTIFSLRSIHRLNLYYMSCLDF